MANFLLIAGSLASVLLACPAVNAQSAATSSAGTSNNAEASAASSTAGSLDIDNLRQIDTTENNSQVGGTVNNIGVQNLGGLDIPGRSQQGDVICEVPILEAGLIGTNPGNDFDSVVSGIVSLRVPLPTQSQRACEERSTILVEQASLDTTLNLISWCIELHQQGVALTDKAPERLKDTCAMIEID